MNGKGPPPWAAWKEKLNQYKYVLLVMAAGVLLLLLPGGGSKEHPEQSAGTAAEGFDLESFEDRLAMALSQVEGAGKAQVVLTLKNSGRKVLAQDTQRDASGGASASTVLVSGSDRSQEVVELQSTAPQFQGALVVCPGGDDPQVQLRLLKAVSVLTGLGSDRISICKSG